jgi:hypothetical protein
MQRGAHPRQTIFVARAFLATLILGSLLAATIPFAAASSGAMCALACCAGRPPHAAGSCMHGSCQAAIPNHHGVSTESGSDRVTHPIHTPIVEKLCSLSSTSRRAIVTQINLRSNKPTANATVRMHFSAAALVKPCQPNCGGGASGSGTFHRQKDSVVVAHGTRPRPPTDLRLFSFARHGAQNLDALCRESAPRGPPISIV